MRLLKLILTTALFTGIFYYVSQASSSASLRPADKYITVTPTTAAKPKRIVITALKKPVLAQETKVQAEEDVPWDELRAEFMRDLEENMHQLAPEKAQHIMATYHKERDSFMRRIDALVKERNRYYYYDKKEEKIVFRDQRKYTELNKEVTSSFEEYDSKVEAIFADHYPAVEKLRQQFEDYMQVYNRDEHLIGIGL